MPIIICAARDRCLEKAKSKPTSSRLTSEDGHSPLDQPSLAPFFSYRHITGEILYAICVGGNLLNDFDSFDTVCPKAAPSLLVGITA